MCVSISKEAQMARIQCPICSKPLETGQVSWHFLCRNCSYEHASLTPSINTFEKHAQIDEQNREHGLAKVRLANFEKLLEQIKKTQSKEKPRLLDVGCAHGWFLDLAGNDFEVLGIEPDQALFDYSKSRGKSVRFGYFPESILPDEKFDVIIFNDVIEHIPDIQTVFAACYDKLNIDGILVLNLPNSSGFFYRLSKLLMSLRLKTPFERMWQKGFPSPHVHYFNQTNLTSLGAKFDFSLAAHGHLATISLKGLFTRIAYDKSKHPILNFGLFLSVLLLFPFLSALPKDIIFSVFKKT